MPFISFSPDLVSRSVDIEEYLTTPFPEEDLKNVISNAEITLRDNYCRYATLAREFLLFGDAFRYDANEVPGANPRLPHLGLRNQTNAPNLDVVSSSVLDEVDVCTDPTGPMLQGSCDTRTSAGYQSAPNNEPDAHEVAFALLSALELNHITSPVPKISPKEPIGSISRRNGLVTSNAEIQAPTGILPYSWKVKYGSGMTSLAVSDHNLAPLSTSATHPVRQPLSTNGANLEPQSQTAQPVRWIAPVTPSSGSLEVLAANPAALSRKRTHEEAGLSTSNRGSVSEEAGLSLASTAAVMRFSPSTIIICQWGTPACKTPIKYKDFKNHLATHMPSGSTSSGQAPGKIKTVCNWYSTQCRNRAKPMALENLPSHILKSGQHLITDDVSQTQVVSQETVVCPKCGRKFAAGRAQNELSRHLNANCKRKENNTNTTNLMPFPPEDSWSRITT